MGLSFQVLGDTVSPKGRFLPISLLADLSCSEESLNEEETIMIFTHSKLELLFPLPTVFRGYWQYSPRGALFYRHQKNNEVGEIGYIRVIDSQRVTARLWAS